MRMVKSTVLASAVVGAFALSLPTSSNAATYDFYAGGCNSGLNCGSDPTHLIATATTSVVAGGIQVSVHIVDTNYYFLQAGGPPLMTFNTTVANSSLTLVTAPTQNLGTWALSGPISPFDGQGSFTSGIGYTPNNNNIFQTDLVFVISGLGLSDFIANNLWNVMALDMCNGSTSTNSCTSGEIGRAHV